MKVKSVSVVFWCVSLCLMHCVDNDLEELKRTGVDMSASPDMSLSTPEDMMMEASRDADMSVMQPSDMTADVERMDLAQSCALAGCDMGQWCDGDDGACKVGCDQDLQCGEGQVCDVASHECVCASNFVNCSGSCVQEDAMHCGDACMVCEGGGDNSSNSCVQGQCVTSCNDGFLSCGGACVACPVDVNATQFECGAMSGACEIKACASGLSPCASGCCALADATTGAIDPTGGETYDIALRLDELNRPHLGYLASSPPRSGWWLNYMSWDGAMWTKQSDLDYPQHASGSIDVDLVLNESGSPLLSYIGKGTNGRYKHVYMTAPNAGMLWQETRLASLDYASRLSADRNPSSGAVGVVYDRLSFESNRSSYHVEYVEAQGSVVSTVMTVGEGERPKIVFDSQGNPHVVFIEFKTTSSGLLYDVGMSYAYRSGSTWRTSTIDDEFARAFHIAVDAQDNVHLVYFNDDVNELRYERKSSGSNAFTGLDVVAAVSGISEGRFDLAVDSHGWPHVVYLSSNGLTHTYWTGTSWQSDLIMVPGVTHIALALDSFDHPHLAFGQGNDRELAYIRWDGTSWVGQ